MKKISLLFLAVLMCFSALGCSANQENVPAALQYATVSSDGSALFATGKGGVESISGDVYSAVKTKDRGHTLVLEEDGTLSVAVGAEKSKLAEDVFSIPTITDDAVLYMRISEDGEFYRPGDYSYSSSEAKKDIYRYTFSTSGTAGVHYRMGETKDYVLASEGGAVLYTEKPEGKDKYYLYMVPGDGTVAETIATSESEIDAIYVSGNGSICVWEEKSGGDYNVVLNVKGEKFKVFSVDEQGGYNACFNREGNFGVIVDYLGDSVAIWTPETEVVKVRMTGEPYGTIYTKEGNFAQFPETKATTVYIPVESDDNAENLYAVTLDGNREKLITNATRITVRNGMVYYINQDETLYSAKLADSTLEEETKIADGVNTFAVSADGTGVLYVRDVAEDDIGSLYYSAGGKEKPIRLESECFCDAYYSKYSDKWTYTLPASFSEDGKNIFYFVDVVELPDELTYAGTLMCYNIKNKEAVRVGSDVLAEVEGDNIYGQPPAEGIYYFRYNTTGEDEYELLCDLMYWDGNESQRMASDIVK